MPAKLIIWGASGHALVVADIVRSCGAYEVVGFLDDINSVSAGAAINGLPILSGREQLDVLKDEGVKDLIIGIGDSKARLRLSEVARQKGFKLAKAVHPEAIIAHDVKVGAGTVIAAGAVVNPAAKIGKNVIINTCASVDHECRISDGVHISPGVHLAGGVRVGRGAWIGIGAVVADRVRIAAGAVIGAGAVVINDIPADVIAYGVPAKVIRKRTSNE